MRQFCLVLLLTFSWVGMVKAQATGETAATPELRKTILKLDEDHDHGMTTGDVDSLERIIAEDVFQTGTDGKLSTKAEVLASVQSRKGRVPPTYNKHEDLQMHVYGDTVVTTGRSITVHKEGGKEILGPSRRFTIVWHKRGGQWQMVALHATTETQK